MKRDFFNKIVNLLGPHMEDSPFARKALVNLALGVQSPLKQHVEWTGSARDFTTQLLAVLVKHGDDNGKPAIDQLLATAAEQMGMEDTAQAEELRAELATLDSAALQWDSADEQASEPQQAERELAQAVERKRQGYALLVVDSADEDAELDSAEIRNPYKALLHYTIADADDFYGRDDAIAAMLNAMQKHPLTVLHAESGAGKTSLLQAGIAARLLADGHLPLLIRPNQRTPQLAIKQSLLPSIETEPLFETFNKLDLLAFLTAATESMEAGKNICILLDQFEEFFIYLSRDEQRQFAEELGNCLAEPSLNVRWVIALRKEYFADLHKLRPFVQDPFANEYQLERLDAAAALDVILKPAEAVGISYEAGVPQAIVKELQSEEAAHLAQVTPPHLQLVCSTLVDELHAPNKRVTKLLYWRLGRADTILRGQLRRVLQKRLSNYYLQSMMLLHSLVSSTNQLVQRDANELLQLLQPYDVSAETLDLILNELQASHIIRQERSQEPITYELTHAYLINEIEFSPELLEQKAIQELLEQEYRYWEEYDALLRPQILQRLTLGWDYLTQLDEAQERFVLMSALVAGVDVNFWLDAASPTARFSTLIDLLAHSNADVRVRAAKYLKPYFHTYALEPLLTIARDDPEMVVREAALATLKHKASNQARDLLHDLLAHDDEAERVAAVTHLTGFLDESSTSRLYAHLNDDESTVVQRAILQALAHEQAEPFRQDWQPLRQTSFERLAGIYEQLRALKITVPNWFMWLSWPARAVRRVTFRPISSLIAMVALISVYLLFAQFRGLFPFQRWAAHHAIPRAEINTILQNGDHLFVGSERQGVGVMVDDSWIGWQQVGLPMNNSSGTLPIADLAALTQDNELNRLFAFVRGGGVYESDDMGASWHPLPTFSTLDSETNIVDGALTLDLTVYSRVLVIASDQGGLIGRRDLDSNWQRLDGALPNLPQGAFELAAFDPFGRLYVSSNQFGTYRGTGIFPYEWEQITSEPIAAIDFSTNALTDDLDTFMAIGSPATRVGCLTATGQLQELLRAESDVITSLTANPDGFGSFYIGVADGRVEGLNCEDGLTIVYDGALVTRNASALGADQAYLMQASDSGIYVRFR